MNVSAQLRRVRGSVRLRVTVLAAAVIAVTLTAGSLLLLDLLESRLVDDIRSGDRALLVRNADQILSGGLDSVAVAPGDPVDTTYRIPRPTGYPTVITITGDVFRAASAGEGAGAFGVTVPAAEARAGTFVQELTDGERSSIAGTTELLGADQALPGARLLVTRYQLPSGVSLLTASSLAEVERTLGTTRTLLWVGVPLLVLVAAALAWLLVGRALRPVHAVTTQVAAIGADSLHERVPVPPTADEVNELAVTMNSMLDRLESATLTGRRLVSDAAHELRTPIAVMRAELEVARAQHDTDWPSVASALEEEVERLRGLVDDLVLIARMAERQPAHETFSMHDAVRDIGARRRRVAVRLAPEPSGSVDVEGDPVAVAQALDHLVANAARHAGSTVEISMDVDDAAVTVHVDDDGPGIAPSDRQRVLERFVRLDEGRSRDAGGSGLGLAVAAEVAAAHGGTVEVWDSPLGGARVSFTVRRDRTPAIAR